MYLESKSGRDGSPWRIKVTVEAEQAGPEINRSIRTSKVAHEDFRHSSPVKRPARRSRKNAPAPVGDFHSLGASPRRRKNSLQVADLIEIPDDATNDYSLSEIEPSTYNDKDTERSTSSEIQDHHFPPTLIQRYSPTTTATTDKSEGHHDSQREQATTTKPESADVPGSTSPGFPPEEDWSEDKVEDAVLGAEAPGDATVLEGEDFSMVSVDSLSSNVRYNDHSSPTLSSHHTKESANKLANISYMPSSPPTYLPSYHRTPLPSDSPPKYPAAPVQSSVHHSHVETPLQESARKSGRALQNVLTGPHAESRPGETSSRDAIFNGFSAGTRRQLRESLYAGQSLATPPLASQSNFGLGLTGAPHLAAPVPTFSSPFHSPVRRNSNSVTHRLPTPDEKEATSSQAASSEPTVSGEVVYPSIAKNSQETPLASPYVEYDAMSWVATGATKATMPAVKSPLQQQTVTEEETLTSSEVSREANGQLQSELQQDTPQHDVPQQEDSEEAKDIWQEEASRTIDDDEDDEDDATPPIFRDELYVKPRRAKLPGTWRRTSQANFHYSDSPEPEDVSTRKVSAATSASGIMTPPITEDERLTEGIMTPGEESESDEAEEDPNEHQEAKHAKERPDEDEARSTIRSNRSQKSNLSTETDDTGGFWHSNLPAVFNRPSTRRARTTISPDTALNLDLSVDESFSPGSPLKNTMLDFSPEKTGRTYEKRERVIGAIKRAPQSDSGLLPTPLRLSLLKSSKIRESPGKSISLKSQERGMNESFSHGDSSSMASDARQLHNEFTQQLNATRDNSTIDLTQEPSSDDVTVSVQSYVEDLNRESPTKVRVNFNDSVAESARAGHTHDSHGRSIMLSPKKQYPPLFDHAPSLKPSKGNGQTDGATSARPRVRKGGFVSRLTDSFWDAVVTAPTPADAKPTILISPSPSPAPSAIERKQTAPSATSTTQSVPDHVLRLRRKYGLLPHVHPFTYQHIRTLHRMLNSARGMTGGTCIIPASGPLPADLASLVGQTKTNDLDQSFTWTEKYVHVVDSFMSLLLPALERQRLVDHTTREWGDEEALRYKGYDSKGRNGTDKVFPVEMKGKIMSLWVANIMQDIVWKEEMNAKKRMIRDMMANVSKTEDSELLQKIKHTR